jgi:hypothetical protein
VERRIHALVEKREAKKKLGRPTNRCEDNIKMDLRKIILEGVECIDVVQERKIWWTILKTVINFQVPRSTRKLLTE